MIKNILRDILPPKDKSEEEDKKPSERKSIRDIPLPSGRRSVLERSETPKREIKIRRLVFWLAGIIAVVGLIFFISAIFSGAAVSITPRETTGPINLNIVAGRDPSGGFSYGMLSFEQTDKESVPAESEKKVEQKASGTIIVYNNYSTANQRLIKNTRFETSEGLIYRINQSIVVPGKRTISGKTIPGSVEAAVFADSPGEKYNIGTVDFTVPGFKNDASRYKSIRARSKTSMTGGFVGTVKTVSPEKAAAVRETIRTRLAEKLTVQANGNLPDDSILYDSARQIRFESLPESGGANNSVILSEKAVFTGFLLKKDALASYIAKNLIPGYAGEPVELYNPKELIFKFENSSGDFSLKDTPLVFTLSGKPRLIWLYDEAKLKKDLAGKAKIEAPAVLENYPSVLKSEIIVRPFWKRYFPKNPDGIKVERKLLEQ